MRETMWCRKIVRPIPEFLRQGLTPEELSFTIALGITLGVTPILGSTAQLYLLPDSMLCGMRNQLRSEIGK